MEQEETRPGEKGPPAWQERSGDRDRAIPDEPPDSSSEVDQLVPVEPIADDGADLPDDTDDGGDGSETSRSAGD